MDKQTVNDMRDLILIGWGLALTAVGGLIAFSAGVEEGQQRLLDNRQVECEVIDYTTKDGFFTAVREGIAIRLIEK